MDRPKVKITWRGQGHSTFIIEVINNGYGIEVFDPTRIEGARTPLPHMMNNGSRSDFLMG